MALDKQRRFGDMLVLRCTQKLLKKKPGPATDREDSLQPLLGGWHANLIYLAHSPIVLCVNDKSLLTVLLPGRDFPNLVAVFRNRLIQRLTRMGVSQKAIAEEAAAMELVQIQPSNSKSVLASMNNLALDLEWHVDDRFDFRQANDLEDVLSETPMGALKYRYAIEVAGAVLGLSLHPNQFQVNEAWIVFKLNDVPIRTAQDGSFNCVCLMDASSCFILGNAFVPIDESEPSQNEVRQLLRTAWAYKEEFPAKLFVPTGQFPTSLTEEVETQGIEVVRVPEVQLLPFIGEARAGFKQHRASATSPHFRDRLN